MLHSPLVTYFKEILFFFIERVLERVFSRNNWNKPVLLQNTDLRVSLRIILPSDSLCDYMNA